MTPTGDTPTGYMYVANPPARGVFLVRADYVTPRQSRMVEVSTPQVDQDAGVLMPSKNMANMMCNSLRFCGPAQLHPLTIGSQNQSH